MFVSISGGPQANDEVFLGKLSAANFNVTTDQAITLIGGNKVITKITCPNFSATPTLAAGGFYTSAAKAGNAIVAAAQVYTAGVAGVPVLPTLAKPYVTGTTIYLSLTTAEGGVLTSDIFVYGNILP